VESTTSPTAYASDEEQPDEIEGVEVVTKQATPIKAPVRTHLEILLSYCQQDHVVAWEDFLAEEALSESKKLGEGVYGEVFKANLRGVPVALKIVPFQSGDGPSYEGFVNGERMKNAHDVLPEVIISTELSRLSNPDRPDARGYMTPSFVQLVQAVVVQGEYPMRLIDEWERFKKAKRSENDCPTSYSSPNQLFLVFALSLGGKDLESYKVRSEKEAMSIFLQTALSLAVAEECLEFEHRDLHIGNLLIDKCSHKETIRYLLGEEEIVLESHGVKVAIIDFTNSRIRKGGTTIYLDLSDDEELFQGSGDYQFDIYRLMRDRNEGRWADFTPATNLLWLHYLASKLFAAKKVPTTIRKSALNQMEQLLRYERIKEVVNDAAMRANLTKYQVQVEG